MSNNLVPVAPNLPLPQATFSSQYLNVLNNVFRLFFNLLVNSVRTSADDISSLTTQYWLGI